MRLPYATSLNGGTSAILTSGTGLSDLLKALTVKLSGFPAPAMLARCFG